jgi:hypothetical protein
LIEELTPALQLNKDQPVIHWKACGYDSGKCGYDSGKLSGDLFKDNTGAYELAKAPKMHPRKKHIALKYHHFCEHVSNGTVQINLSDTKDQLADICTKGLGNPSFAHLRKQLHGW